MGFLLRDTRHMKGQTPQAHVDVPRGTGHAVGHHWSDTGPVLVVRDDAGTLHHLPLEGELNLEVLEPRYCVGRHDDGFVACPHGAEADHFDQCRACHPLPDRECVFNPRCNDCSLEFCRAPHTLYLAFYGELPKIGMTRAARGDARLVEQGADAFAVVAHAGDRAEARRLEDMVTRQLGVPQSRRAQEVLSRTARDVPWTAIENAYRALVPRLGAVLGMAPGPLERLDGHQGRFPLPAVPTLAGIEGHHAGRILGVKGKYVFYQAEEVEADGDAPPPPVWGLNLKSVVTHRVRFDPERTRSGPQTAPDTASDGPRVASAT